jgi:hypothetical protein
MTTTSRHQALLKRLDLRDPPPSLVASGANGPPIVFWHLRVDSPGQGLYSTPSEAAYSIHVQLRETTSLEIREVGRVNRKEFAKAGSLWFFDLQSPRHVLFNTPFHTIRSYVPLPALREFAEEAGGRRQVFLRRPSCGSDDPIVRHLF